MATALCVTVLPLASESSVEVSSSDPDPVETTTRSSLMANEGAGVLVAAAVPVALVALPLVARGWNTTHRLLIAVTVMLAAIVLLAGLSIGLFFVPTTIAMATALVAHSRERPQPARLT